ncbi:SsrA-binding protein SmpB [Pseudomonas nitroreducens]
MMKPKHKDVPPIARNRRAGHDYFIEKRIVAGLKLEGWEVKSLRAGKAELVDCYVKILHDEAYIIGARIDPLITAGTHDFHDPQRTRKLLLSRKEISDIRESVEVKGYTCLALDLHWDRHLVKCTLGIAKGKKNHDKREADKVRDMDREARAASKTERMA